MSNLAHNRFIGVALAGGLSTRAANGDKLLLELGGKTIIEHCVSGMENQCEKIYVVTGHRPERFDFLSGTHPKVETVRNARYRSGMFASAAAGLEHALLYAAKNRTPVLNWYIFLTPGDHALIPRAVYRTLAQSAAGNPGADSFVPVFLGREGHPLMIRDALARRLLINAPRCETQAARGGLRGALEACGSRPALVDCLERGVLMDIDTPEDFAVAQAEYDKYSDRSG